MNMIKNKMYWEFARFLLCLGIAFVLASLSNIYLNADISSIGIGFIISGIFMLVFYNFNRIFGDKYAI